MNTPNFNRSFGRPMPIQLGLMLLLVLLAVNSHGQNLFQEKFKGCNTDTFTMERDTVTAKTDYQTLTSIVISSLSQQALKDITGTLALQILVDNTGSSCLISVKNDTNMQTKKLRLKENIDNRLRWEEVTEKVSAVVVFKFDEGTISIKRLGIDGDMRVHELRP